MEYHEWNSRPEHEQDLSARQRWGSRSLSSTHGERLQGDYVGSHEDFQALHDDFGDRNLSYDEEDASSAVPRTRQARSFASDGQSGKRFLELRNIQERLVHLESQLSPSTQNEGSSQPGAKLVQDAMVDMDISIDDRFQGSFAQNETIPQLVEKTWFDFMNKDAGKAKEYAIEVLKGKPDYYHPSKLPDKTARIVVKDSTDETASVPRTPGGLLLPVVEKARHTPDRIRINSSLVLSALASIDKTIDSTAPVVMLRPFKLLVLYDTRIRDYTDDLSCQIEDCSLSEEELQGRKKELSHMQCLTQFIDNYITPPIQRLNDKTTAKIHFKDLWYIFPPGEDIYMPLKRLRGALFRDAMDATPETFIRRYNMLWRVTGTGGGRRDLARSDNQRSILKPNPFQVNCYYVDFDGKFFLPTVHTFSILPFNGEIEITSLDFFPVRFMKDGVGKLKEHSVKGWEMFRTIIATGFGHFYYSGLTMTTQPCGCPLEKEPIHQEFVESEVIVDFKMALLRHPSWRPKSNLWKRPPNKEGELHEPHPVRYWKDTEKKNQLANSYHDYVHDDYHIDKEIAATFRNAEQIFAPIPSGWASNAEMVPKKDLCLLAGRAFAFVLRTRSFAPLWIWALSPIKPQKESLNNLRLRDNGFKDTIQKLVNSHFKQKSISSKYEYNVIPGKGSGLVILLHGAPGVGKTSTAESIAAASGKPLFQITCGDLGLTPGEVEKALKEIFRFAQIWNCVLLLDECDIFLAQRNKNDIVRNGLVAVFLRTLEFYTGVLFLTTNRVGVLDEAIRSRLTYTAYYPPLDQKQTQEIWNVNLRLLRERHPNLDVDETEILRFARDHFRSNMQTNSTWNGRQIQNAFKVATALADWDDQTTHEGLHGMHDCSDNRRPRLCPSHFEVIAHGTQAFDEYLREATGYTDAERAYNEMVRADDHQFEVSQAYVYAHNPLPGEYPRRTSLSPVQSRRHSSSVLPLQNIEPNMSQQYAGPPENRRLSVGWQHQSIPSPKTLQPIASNGRHRRLSSLPSAQMPAEMLSHSPRKDDYWPSYHAVQEYPKRSDGNTPAQDSSDDSLDLKTNNHMDPNNDTNGFNRTEREQPTDEW